MMNVAQPIKKMTLAEFEALPKEDHLNYELIDGLVMMSPSPSFEHQKIGVRLLKELLTALENTTCEPLYEYDIRLAEDVLKPDVMIFCDNDHELPVIVFEILSPSTRFKDLRIKMVTYEEIGIKEYWIIDPKVKTITVHDFLCQISETYGLGEIIFSQTLPELTVTVSTLFS